MKKVLFFLESLAGGGAEKVLSTLVQHIDRSRFDVTVCVVSGGGLYEESIASCVGLKKIFEEPEVYHGVKKLWYRLKYNLIYKILPAWLVYRLFVPQGFDVEIAFVEGFATKVIAASSNKGAKKITWVHIDLVKHPWPIKSGVFKSFEEELCSYNKFDKIVCVSKSVENIMQASYGLKNTLTIYNPLDEKSILTQGQQTPAFDVDGRRFNIVSVGRYTKQKGYDLLIQIVAKIKETHANVHLWLIGEGTERIALEHQIVDLGLVDYVTLTGFQKNPYALLSQMDLFVCSSRAEGFSLAIAESMILGVPVISMNCSGPNELIGKNEHGILCDSYDELRMEIVKAIEGNKIVCAQSPIVNLTKIMKQINALLSL